VIVLAFKMRENSKGSDDKADWLQQQQYSYI